MIEILILPETTWTKIRAMLETEVRSGTNMVQMLDTRTTVNNTHLPPMVSARGPPASMVSIMP